MYIEKALPEQKEQALAILLESAVWLSEKGSSQWEDVLDGKDRHGLSEAVDRGDVYFYYNNEKQLVGMFAAWKKPSAWDCFLWKETIEEKNAVYVHRIIIRPEYQGREYGSLLLKDIKSFFKETTDEIRLDCLSENQNLNNFYLKNGFKNVNTKKSQEKTMFNLMIFELK